MLESCQLISGNTNGDPADEPVLCRRDEDTNQVFYPKKNKKKPDQSYRSGIQHPWRKKIELLYRVTDIKIYNQEKQGQGSHIGNAYKDVQYNLYPELAPFGWRKDCQDMFELFFHLLRDETER